MNVAATTVTLLGSFNPAIMSPDWMVANDVVRLDDPASVKVVVGAGLETVEFEAPWFTLSVSYSTFTVSSNAEHASRLLELVRRTFTLLSHTPVEAAACQLRQYCANGGVKLRRRLLGPVGWAGLPLEFSTETIRAATNVVNGISTEVTVTWPEGDTGGAVLIVSSRRAIRRATRSPDEAWLPSLEELWTRHEKCAQATVDALCRESK